MKEISIIIPAYNVEHLLDRCLASLINQDIAVPYEILVVNDGSKDNTWAVIQKWSEKYPNIVVGFTKINGGQSSARNLALDNASGRYIAFVDSDDYVESNFLSELYSLIIKNNCDISMCSMNRVYGDDGRGRRFNEGCAYSFVSDNICEVICNSSFAPWNKLYSRKLWNAVRFPEGMTYEDMAIIPQIIYKANKVAYTSDILYHYYVNPGSTIMSMQKKGDRNILRAMHILESSSLQSSPEVLENIYIRRVLFSFAKTALCFETDCYDLVNRLVEETHQKYRNIINNSLIQNAPIVDKIYVTLLLKGHVKVSSYILKLEAILKICVKRILGR